MLVFNGQSFAACYKDSISYLLANGEENGARGTTSKELLDVALVIEDPTSWRYSDGVDKDYIKLKLITGKECKFRKPELSLLFPYYDYDLGVVPVWYRSAEIIKKAHDTRMREMGLKQSGREKLGF